MPRTARPPSSFVDDRHVLYAAWVIMQATRLGLPFTPVVADTGLPTDKVMVSTSDGTTILLVIPYPPDDWRFM